MARRTTCTSHCAACGRHFAGDGAFDLDRRGEAATGRRCVSPLDEPRLTAAADDGVCRISGEHDDDGPLALDPVTVYGLAANRTEAKRAAYAAFEAARASSTRPVCGEPSSASRHATPTPSGLPALAGSMTSGSSFPTHKIGFSLRAVFSARSGQSGTDPDAIRLPAPNLLIAAQSRTCSLSLLDG